MRPIVRCATEIGLAISVSPRGAGAPTSQRCRWHGGALDVDATCLNRGSITGPNAAFPMEEYTLHTFDGALSAPFTTEPQSLNVCNLFRDFVNGTAKVEYRQGVLYE